MKTDTEQIKAQIRLILGDAISALDSTEDMVAAGDVEFYSRYSHLKDTWVIQLDALLALLTAGDPEPRSLDFLTYRVPKNIVPYK